MATRKQESNLTDKNIKSLNKKERTQMSDLLAKGMSQGGNPPAKKTTKKK